MMPTVHNCPVLVALLGLASLFRQCRNQCDDVASRALATVADSGESFLTGLCIEAVQAVVSTIW